MVALVVQTTNEKLQRNEKQQHKSKTIVLVLCCGSHVVFSELLLCAVGFLPQGFLLRTLKS
jgi:hypothetical protein